MKVKVWIGINPSQTNWGLCALNMTLSMLHILCNSHRKFFVSIYQSNPFMPMKVCACTNFNTIPFFTDSNKYLMQLKVRFLQAIFFINYLGILYNVFWYYSTLLTNLFLNPSPLIDPPNFKSYHFNFRPMVSRLFCLIFLTEALSHPASSIYRENSSPFLAAVNWEYILS